MIAEFALTMALQGPLDAIEECESDGRNVMNSSGSSASGYFQITKDTWVDNGGLEFAPTAIQATRAQQMIVAKRLLASRGTQPWDASKSCWGGQVAGKSQTGTQGDLSPGKHHSSKPAPKHHKPSTAKHAKTVVVKAGDTLSGIAEANGTTWQDLYSKNTNLSSPHLIYVGDTIYL